MNQAELARQLASERYPESVCRTLLRQDEAGKAAEYLRATDPARAVELAIAVLETATYETQGKVLEPQSLLSVPFSTLTRLLNDLERINALDASGRRALVRPIVEWLELGKEEHLDLLDRALAGLRAGDLAGCVDHDPAFFPRLWRLVEAKLGSTFEAQAVAILQTDQSTFIALAAAHLAASLGIALQSLGISFTIGGINSEDVALHAYKPMLELMWRHRPEVFWDQLEACLPKVRRWGIPWMIDFLEPTVAMVDAAPSRTIVLRADRLVVQLAGTFKSQGRVASKLHKTVAAAEKDFDKRLAAAQTKLGQSRQAWDGLVAPAVCDAMRAKDPCAALRSAAGGPTVDVEGLMRRGVDPREHETCWVNALQYGSVRRFLEAGFTSKLDAALLAQARWNPSQAAWASLNHKACKLLIDAGARVDALDRHGWTALHYAAAYGWTELIETLLAAGADKECAAGLGAEVLGQRPIDVAEERGRHLAAALLR